MLYASFLIPRSLYYIGSIKQDLRPNLALLLYVWTYRTRYIDIVMGEKSTLVKGRIITQIFYGVGATTLTLTLFIPQPPK